jgi:hypothetical protein
MSAPEDEGDSPEQTGESREINGHTPESLVGSPETTDEAPEIMVDVRIPAAQFRVLVACLVLGTLDRITSAMVGPEAGVWCLARPRFGEEALERGLLSEAFVEALRGADELAAIEERIPEAFPRAIARLREAAIAELHSCSDRDYRFEFPCRK